MTEDSTSDQGFSGGGGGGGSWIADVSMIRFGKTQQENREERTVLKRYKQCKQEKLWKSKEISGKNSSQGGNKLIPHL